MERARERKIKEKGSTKGLEGEIWEEIKRDREMGIWRKIGEKKRKEGRKRDSLENEEENERAVAK